MRKSLLAALTIGQKVWPLQVGDLKVPANFPEKMSPGPRTEGRAAEPPRECARGRPSRGGAGGWTPRPPLGAGAAGPPATRPPLPARPPRAPGPHPRRPARSPAVVRLEADAAAAPVHLGARPAGHDAPAAVSAAPRALAPWRAPRSRAPGGAGGERGRARGAGPERRRSGRLRGTRAARGSGRRAAGGTPTPAGGPRGGGVGTWPTGRRPIGGAGGPGRGRRHLRPMRARRGRHLGQSPGNRAAAAQWRGAGTLPVGRRGRGGPPAANGSARVPAPPGTLPRGAPGGSAVPARGPRAAGPLGLGNAALAPGSAESRL